VPEYLRDGVMTSRPSVQTISNAMDVGNPSNFARMMDLYQNDVEAVRRDIVGYAFSDPETQSAIAHVSRETGYVLDPHGAVGYLGMKKFLTDSALDANGIFLETAHPAKFREVVEEALGTPIALPDKLARFAQGVKQSIPTRSEYSAFRQVLKRELAGA